MSKTRVELNYAGFNAVRKSPEMVSILSEITAGIVSRAGDGYAADSKQMSTRAIASVYTDTAEAMQEELKNNTLQKAVRG